MQSREKRYYFHTKVGGGGLHEISDVIGLIVVNYAHITAFRLIGTRIMIDHVSTDQLQNLSMINDQSFRRAECDTII